MTTTTIRARCYRVRRCRGSCCMITSQPQSPQSSASPQEFISTPTMTTSTTITPTADAVATRMRLGGFLLPVDVHGWPYRQLTSTQPRLHLTLLHKRADNQILMLHPYSHHTTLSLRRLTLGPHTSGWSISVTFIDTTISATVASLTSSPCHTRPPAGGANSRGLPAPIKHPTFKLSLPQIAHHTLSTSFRCPIPYILGTLLLFHFLFAQWHVPLERTLA